MSEEKKPQEIPIERIPLADLDHASPNLRKTFNPERMGELVASVRERGVLTALWVRPRWCVGWNGEPVEEPVKALSLAPYEVVAGNRRCKAATVVKLETVPCQVYILTDREAIEMQLIENLQREDLDPIEEAQGYQQMLEMKDPKTGEPAWTIDTIADRLKRSGRDVRNRLKLLNLSDEAREYLQAGELKPGIAMLIGGIPDPAARDKATKEILAGYGEGPMTYREAQAYIEDHCMKSTKSADFDTEDPTLVPEMGACSSCPFLAKNSKDVQVAGGNARGGGVRGDMCLNPACFARKTTANINRWSEQNSGPGRVILNSTEQEKWVVNGRWVFAASKIVPLNEKPDTSIFGSPASDKEAGKTWAQLTEGRGVEVRVARLQDGAALEGIELDKALAAAAANGFKIKNPFQRDPTSSTPKKKPESLGDKLRQEEEKENQRHRADLDARIRKETNRAAVVMLAKTVKSDPVRWLTACLKEPDSLALDEDLAAILGKPVKEVVIEIECGVPARVCVVTAQLMAANFVCYFDGSMQTPGVAFLKANGVDFKAIEKATKKQVEADDKKNRVCIIPNADKNAASITWDGEARKFKVKNPSGHFETSARTAFCAGWNDRIDKVKRESLAKWRPTWKADEFAAWRIGYAQAADFAALPDMREILLLAAARKARAGCPDNNFVARIQKELKISREVTLRINDALIDEAHDAKAPAPPPPKPTAKKKAAAPAKPATGKNTELEVETALLKQPIDGEGFRGALLSAGTKMLEKLVKKFPGADKNRRKAWLEEIADRAQQSVDGDPEPAPAGKLATLKEQILGQLRAAGAAGATVQDIAKPLGVKAQNVHVWFATTGKKNPDIQKVGESRYALSSAALSAGKGGAK